MSLKKTCSTEEVCKGCPSQMAKMLTHVRKLGFHDDPAYAKLRWAREMGSTWDCLGFDQQLAFDQPADAFLLGVVCYCRCC